MRLRPHRRNIVVWNSSAAAVGRPGHRESLRGARPSRARRLRWWLRIGALLTVLGVLRLARTIRIHPEPVLLLAGTLLAMAGYMLPSAVAFFLGVLVLIIALLKGIRDQEQRRDPAG